MELNTGKELQNGKYRILGILGQGGFGITYLAEQTALCRKVAIKEFFMKDLCNRDETSSFVSVPSVGSKDLVERFKQKFLKEARLIASFGNSHIIKIHDVFEENGTAYYVMEYLEGKSLKALVDENGALPEALAVKYICQVGKALKEVHASNLLHLDVKPANIMLGKNGNAVLIDFGISKHYDESGSQTSSAGIGISEGYAPLEQYEAGALKTFTPVTDIYALGATLFFLLTGTRPPKASEVMNFGLPELPEGISASVRSAVEAAMQPAIGRRPQSVGEFLRLVESKETKFESDATSLSMGTGQKIASGSNNAVAEEEIATEVAETPSVTPKQAENSNRPKEKKSGKGLWIVILLLLIICGAAVGFMLFGGGSDIKKDSAKETAGQIAQKADTPTIQTDKKDTITPLKQIVPAEPEVEQTAQLKINGAPDGANVYVDGKYFDETPLKGATISIGEHTIKVAKDGYETYEKKHTFNSHAAAITVNLAAKAKPQPQETISSKGKINGHEYVDLGLSVKWATCNVGASKPQGYGNHYAWGEISTKSNYSSGNSVTYGKNFSDIGGYPTYDVACNEWGSSWRLPTKAEFDELCNENNCTWTWTTQNGVEGYKVTSKKNGNSIFLPAAGWRSGTSLNYQGTDGYYWSSTPRESLSSEACYLYFDSDSHFTNWSDRNDGQSVRPVIDNE
ncbi:MAG: protein kinase [Bacteroidaceae bacterium]|nr:protein kinase [Bacteroidaceae bacterium]